MINPIFVVFNVALTVLAVRSALLLLRFRCSPFSLLGWALAAGYGAASALEFASPDLHRQAGQVAYGFLLVLAAAFVIAGVRDEAQVEPLLWPMRLGPTRAERRRPPAQG